MLKLRLYFFPLPGFFFQNFVLQEYIHIHIFKYISDFMLYFTFDQRNGERKKK